ncbi:MAG TPA: prenyltransferase/squalene oxidase repeat-containing protein [Gemmataceae bacterium]|nr:prenyltransferase/squalene oxidase repeat-containing protein [Gemmataceae bacterium]
MATKPQAAARPPVIRAPAGSGYGGIDLMRLLPVWIGSAVMHTVIFLLFLFLGGMFGLSQSQGSTVSLNVNPEVSAVDDQEDTKDLTNDDLGNDPDVPLNYNVERLADVSVPGVAVPDESIGIPGGAEGPTMSVPPPPGTNRGVGGGAVEDNGLGNALSTQGAAGGYLGLRAAGGFGGRSAATKEQMVKEGGGNAASEAAVGLGLKFLAVHQSDDGRWAMDGFHTYAREKPGLSGRRFTCNCSGQGMHNDTAGTAFGVLPFLAAGVTHRNNNKMKEDYTKNVDAALRFLMAHQDAKTGDLGGGMYAHGLATIALCEAFGLTADRSLKAAAQRGIDFIVTAQDPASGGWRYSPRSGGDTSVVGWQLMALKSGQMAGLNVPNPTLDGATKWLNSCQTSNGGGYGYTGPQDTPTMSAVGLLCRQYLGWSPRHAGLINGVAQLNKYMPGPGTGINSIYFNYYATQVMHHMGREHWDNWNPRMRDVLVNSQDQGRAAKRPHQVGSWGPEGDAHGGNGGRIMQTSLSLLTLEVYYRHLPLYRRDVTTGKEMENK